MLSDLFHVVFTLSFLKIGLSMMFRYYLCIPFLQQITSFYTIYSIFFKKKSPRRRVCSLKGIPPYKMVHSLDHGCMKRIISISRLHIKKKKIINSNLYLQKIFLQFFLPWDYPPKLSLWAHWSKENHGGMLFRSINSISMISFTFFLPILIVYNIDYYPCAWCRCFG